MDLSTNYLGLKLKNPIVSSASPLSEDLDTVKALEEAGASAIVAHSLFEEQITHESGELDHYLNFGSESYAEATSYFPEAEDYRVGPIEYLDHISDMKKAVDIPVIGSLNGISEGGWTKYAKNIQDAGADALELNIYYIPTDESLSSSELENMYVDTLKSVKANVTIPVSVKLSPFFTTLANMAKRLDDAGADGLVLFNRFYQPDFDLEKLEVYPNLQLSTNWEMRLPLRWISILSSKVNASLAATSGVHNYEDVLKLMMAGADVTMMASELLKNGTKRVSEILKNLETWMEEHEYDSIKMMQGSMSQKSCAEPTAFERANYMKTLQSYKATY